MNPVDGGTHWQPPDTPLVETVVALGKEIQDLRRSARVRAVIEQAKGILVERHGITLDEAFAKLRAMSQDHNVRVLEVAATIVGVAIPDVEDGAMTVGEELVREQLPASEATSNTWKALRRQPDVRAGVASAMVDAVASATREGDEAAELLLEFLQPFEVAAITMYRVSADGSLRFVGQVGVPGDLVSPWRSIPPSTDIPFVRSVVDNLSLFFPDRASRIVQFPAVARAGSTGFEATATVPVLDEGQVIGVVGLIWNDSQVFDELRQHAIIKAVQRVAPLLLRNAAAADPELDWLDTVLRLHLDPWLLMEAVPTSGAMASDFVVRDVAATVDAGHSWIGRRLLEIWPDLSESPTLESLRGLVRAGGSWSAATIEPSSAPWGTPGSRVRAVRLGRRVVLVWRPATVG